MKTIVFSGPLQKEFPNGIQVAGESAADCVALLQNHPRFAPGAESIRVKLPHFGSRDAFYEATSREVIELVQIDGSEEEFSGGGAKVLGVIQIIIGAIIIYASWGTGSAQGMAMMAAGFGMVLGGIMALMMKAPEKPKNETENKSQYLAASKNTVKIGTTIPYLFGRRKVWGHFLSFNVNATNLDVSKPYVPAFWPGIYEGISLGGNSEGGLGGNYDSYGGADRWVGGGGTIDYGDNWGIYGG